MTTFAEMFFDAATEGAPVSVDEQGLMWKPVLRTGVWNVGPNGKPLRVVAGRSTNPQAVIGLQDIVDNYEAGAIEHVTVPVTHNDTVEENRGFVKGLRIAASADGQTHYLMAGHHITEPDTAGKIKRGTIANTSVGLEFDYTRKEDGKKFPIILRHVALTNRPWINRLTPFGVEASEAEEKGFEVCAMEFSEDLTNAEANSLAWDDRLSFADLQVAISEKLDLEVVNISTDRVLLKDGDEMFVAGYSVEDGNVVVADRETWSTHEVDPNPATESTSDSADNIETSTTSEDDTVPKPVEEKTPVAPATEPTPVAEDAVTPVQLSELTTKLSEAEAETARMRAQLDAQAKELRATKTEKTIERFRSIGLSEANGCGAFLVAVRDILLADEGKGLLMLSEEGSDTPTPTTATDIVNRLVGTLPSDEETGQLKAQFSEQAVAAPAGVKPPAEDPEDPADNVQLSEEDLDELHKQMFPAGTTV